MKSTGLTDIHTDILLNVLRSYLEHVRDKVQYNLDLDITCLKEKGEWRRENIKDVIGLLADQYRSQ